MVKKILRTFVTEGTALYLATQMAGGLHFEKGLQSMVITAVALTLGAFFVKPVINILILPLNLMTLNFFKWASHAIMLFLVDLALTEFGIISFAFKGFQTDWFSIPQIFFPQGVVAYIAFSFLISLIAGVIHWIFAHE
jgi:uncharacterized membrane protein YvlD (DUF360 family)